ncbi:hypothetical protein HNO92_002314 [Chromobacterium alkanivorans]|uniref:DUF3108 domain-containing protein n=1 Tax=Chromobacterium alkanivorans TaxID=1071719 RepID=UPI0021672B63|nr:DUF3108 domain-containing protein [Chromobacterium alkanivorans]MCS3804949.1 hypothetical protein [Chromobacterium alkanivorans]MCS3819488.1 hypothetical protein [Chromobacterium alkanivorans]MCS3874000.1 hypothetical protein [Chromobacterium alkanivorans]
MKSRRLILLALALSLALHLGVLGSGLLPDVQLDLPPDQDLRSISVKMQALDADEQPAKPAPQGAVAQLRPAAPKPAPAKPKPAAKKTEASAPLAASEAMVAQAPPSKSVASAPAAEAKADASMPGAESKIASSEPAAEQAAANDKDEASAPAAVTAAADDGYIHPKGKLRGFPRQATLGYQVFYGSAMLGTGTLDWGRGDGGYRLEINANPFIGPKLRYLSEGRFKSKAGLLPDSLQAWRGGQAKESAHFDYNAGQLRYGDQGDKLLDLKPGAQDVFSLAFQLGLKGGELGPEPIQITTGKKVYEYPMHPSGEADYDTGAGKIRVIVFRAQGDGDINEFWLAPEFSNLPVRIQRIDKDKRIDLRAVRIDVNGAPQWKLPPQPTRKHKNDY